MIFFERFEQATTRIINQLWQNDYLGTPARQEAVAQILPVLDFKLWVERLLLVVGIVFLSASILLFFAFNWQQIPPMIKLGGILSVIGGLALLNWVLLRRGKLFVGNLVLSATAFMVGVFMAVFGQIYQTGADSYTLFLTWAIMILPWVVMARFSALWVLWLIVVNLAIYLWWELNLYADAIDESHLLIILSFLHLILYFIMLFAIGKNERWLDKKWTRLLMAILIFAPITGYLLSVIGEVRVSKIDLGFWLSFVIFIPLYLFERFKLKSLPEYSVGFFCATLIVIFAVSRWVFEFLPDELAFFASGGIIIGLFYYAYKYYRHAIKNFVEAD